jgi:uncharacterized protein (TIGR03435 family)
MPARISLRYANMISRIVLFAMVVIGSGLAALSPPQSPAQAPAPLQFEVASVKPLGHPPASGGGPWTVDRGRFKADAAWVRAVIAVAYSTQAVRVLGGPNWLDTERYDFAAKAENADASTDQLRVMIQSLLADRFKLVVHRETKDLPVYTLTVGKSGPKMQPAKDNEKTYGTWLGGQLICTRFDILGLINILSSTLGNPVVDKTGLTGLYDFKLEFTDPRFQRPGNSSQSALDSPPDIFGAVQEQLGLKLEAKRAPVEVLVVDHAERASGN